MLPTAIDLQFQQAIKKEARTNAQDPNTTPTPTPNKGGKTRAK